MQLHRVTVSWGPWAHQELPLTGTTDVLLPTRLPLSSFALSALINYRPDSGLSGCHNQMVNSRLFLQPSDFGGSNISSQTETCWTTENQQQQRDWPLFFCHGYQGMMVKERKQQNANHDRICGSFAQTNQWMTLKEMPWVFAHCITDAFFDALMVGYVYRDGWDGQWAGPSFWSTW